MLNKLKVTRFTAICLLLSSCQFAYSKQLLLKDSQSWDGGAISYPKGEAEISSVKLSLKKNQKTPFHCHPVPTFGYILKGTLKVETKSGKTKIFNEGESVIEVMRTVHRGVALSDEVEILAFYAGAKNRANTILEGDTKHQGSCSAHEE